MLDIILFWVPTEADLETTNQVKAVCLGGEGQPEVGWGTGQQDRKGKEPNRVCDQAGHGWKQMEHTPTGEALGTNLKHTHP